MKSPIVQLLCVYASLMSSASYAQLTYSITNNQVTITGYAGDLAGHLEIPSEIEGYPVTRIGSSALMFCDNLTSINIPDSVVSIGGNAIYGCDSLIKVSLGNGVNTFGNYAFRHCTHLPSVVIPSSVAFIGTGAFSGCYSMTSVYFRGNTPITESWAFGDSSPTIYYRYGTTNWGALYQNHPTAIWPECLASTITPAGFVIDVVASDDQEIVAETCTNMSDGSWIPVATNAMTGAPVEITIPTTFNDPKRFYRVILK